MSFWPWLLIKGQGGFQYIPLWCRENGRCDWADVLSLSLRPLCTNWQTVPLQDCVWGDWGWVSMQMEELHGQQPNGTGTGSRERENYYNSGVTREMSNTGHMGFTAKGLWGNGHRLQPSLVNVITVKHVMKSEEGQAFHLELGWATGNVGESYRLLMSVRKRAVGVFVSPSVSPGIPDWFSRNQIRLRSSSEA